MITHRDRRLHKLMFEDRDYEKLDGTEDGRVEDKNLRPDITVINCVQKDYTVITMRTKDQPKLLFDIVCTLTDMVCSQLGVQKHIRNSTFGMLMVFPSVQKLSKIMSYNVLKLPLQEEHQRNVLCKGWN
ncbi:hypothetical protein Droror1_Dr00012166 [Drosera rotundifolia]